MKHKHAEIVKAFVDGIECEVKGEVTGNWYSVDNLHAFEYANDARIKLEPKPDVELFARADVDGTIWVTGGQIYPNIKITFDGETGKLKSAEVIK